MIWIVLLISVASVACVVVIVKKHKKRFSLNLSESDQGNGQPSFFQLIKQQIQNAPTEPLDYSKFPAIIEGSAGLSYVPGILDALFGRSEGNYKNDWKKVELLLIAINRDRVSNWRILEQNIKNINIRVFDDLVDKLKRSLLTLRVRDIFWDLALQSRDYNAVKWGLSLGTFDMSDNQVADLLLFARHGEFSLFAIHALAHELKNKPEIGQHLLELLPVCRQWAVIQLINHIISDETLLADEVTQQKILIFGMKNCDGIPMEVAFTIANSINVKAFCERAVKDKEVYYALCYLMNTLITEPQPLGGLSDLADPEQLIEAYVAMLEKRQPDIRMIFTLGILQQYLHDKSYDNDLKERVSSLSMGSLSEGIVREGLYNQNTRFLALETIKNNNLVSLLSDVEKCLQENPDWACIDVIGQIGNDENLRNLLNALPKIVDLPPRRNRPFSQKNIIGEEFQQSCLYASIMRQIGKLASNDSIAVLKEAAVDYDPQVRAAACEGFSCLPSGILDEEIKEIIRVRLNDSLPYVVTEAQKAADHAGI